jgi:serine/threonine protein phosphatase PrpC
MFPSAQIYDHLDTIITNDWNLFHNPSLSFLSNGQQIKIDSNANIVGLLDKVDISNTDGCALGVKGHRSEMEDEHVLEKYKIGNFHVDIYAVFDGHGGAMASKTLKNQLPTFILQKLQSLDLKNSSLIQQILRLAFVEYDEILYQNRQLIGTSGSTAIVSLAIYPDDKSYYDVYLINVGDSRGLIVDGNAKILLQSIDHKPSSKFEYDRIIRSGGTVKNIDTHRVNNRLSVSRAFGDFSESSGLKVRGGKYLGVNSPVSPEPDIYHLRVNSEIVIYVILACDGLWDVLSNEDAVNIVLSSNLEMNQKCQKLINTALKYGSRDNISVLVSRISNSIVAPYASCTKNFDYVKKIGGGSYGQVYQICVNPKNCDHIIKYQVSSDPNQTDEQFRLSIDKEYNLGLLASQHNIAPIPTEIIACDTDTNNRKAYGIVMERMDGELTTLVLDKKISENVLTDLIFQVIKIIWTLIQINIWHGDTKICNFLYKGSNVYIADYELSDYLDQKIIRNKLDLPIEEIQYQVFQSHVDLFIKSLFDPNFCGLNISNDRTLTNKVGRAYNNAFKKLNIQYIKTSYDNILLN